MRKVSITDIVTREEWDLACKLYPITAPHALNKVFVDQIIGPNIERINETTGQENDPSYLAYMLEYVVFTTTMMKSMVLANR